MVSENFVPALIGGPHTAAVVPAAIRPKTAPGNNPLRSNGLGVMAPEEIARSADPNSLHCATRLGPVSRQEADETGQVTAVIRVSGVEKEL